MRDDAVNRALAGLSALLLSMTGVPSRSIPPPPPDDVRVVKLLDGNTIIVTPYGDPFTVRLACIHAPSLHQGTAGRAARAALESLLPPGVWVTLSTRSKAADGVDLAEIIPVGATVPVNLSLVQAGMAAPDRKASSPCNQASYREAELSARTRRLGLWGPLQGIRSMGH